MDKKLGAFDRSGGCGRSGRCGGPGKEGVRRQKDGRVMPGLKPAPRHPTGTQSWENTRKTAKGIYYTNGNYEAFARPGEVRRGVENKSAYIVGSGLAALAAACFLVRGRGRCQGTASNILEAMDVAGGGLRRHLRPQPGLCDAGRPGDGGPL